MYKVILHNDDYTPMDFVVSILVNIFHKGLNEAEELMLKVHEEGKAVCGVYVKDIAATKVTQVKEIARKNGFPLMATMELER
jgi:ATP-dependent Clp protease adaptor protein ClpS